MNKIGEVEDFDDLDDGITYCVYCYDEVPDWKGSCCGENHFLSGKDLMDRELELDEIDKQMKFMHEEASR